MKKVLFFVGIFFAACFRLLVVLIAVAFLFVEPTENTYDSTSSISEAEVSDIQEKTRSLKENEIDEQIITDEDLSKKEEIINNENIPKEEELDPNIQMIIDSTNLNEAEAEIVYNTIVEIGFTDIISIKKGTGETVDTLAGFAINLDGYNGILTIENRKLYYIAMNGIELFDADKGGVIDNIEYYALENDTWYISYAKDYISQGLKSPSSASYPGTVFERDQWSVTRYRDVVNVQSYVDSQNSFGAMIRSNFTIQMSHVEDYETPNPLYMVIDDTVVFGELQPYNRETYEKSIN